MSVRLIFRGLCLTLAGWLLCMPGASATHLVGGDLRYVYVGNSQYQIILEVYKDCNSPTQFDLPSKVKLGVVNALSRVVIDSFFMAEWDSVPVLIESQDTCAPPPAGLCYSKATYTRVITLTVPTGGLVLMWGRCCRNESITNLNAPEATGMILSCEIPQETNNSPIFNKPLSVYTCVGKSVDFDQGATDVDGDSLAYFLVLPHTAGSSGNPFPSPVGIFQAVTFAPGYTSQSPLGAATSLTLDKATGQLNMLPTDIGQFVFGIGVQEFRNGVSLGTLRRDVQINIVACPVNNAPKISLSLSGEVRGDTMIFRAGVPRCQVLSVVDVNGAGFGVDSVFMEVLSPIPGAVQPATISYLPGPAPRQAQLCWTPACTETDLAGAVTFRIRDNNTCPGPNLVEKTFFYKILPLVPSAPNLRCVSVSNPDPAQIDLTWVLPPVDSVASPVGIIVERDTGTGFFALDTLPWSTTTWRDLQDPRPYPIGYRLRTLTNCPILTSSPAGNEVFTLQTKAVLQGKSLAEISWDTLSFNTTPSYLLESHDLLGGVNIEGTFTSNTYTFIPCKFEGTMRISLQDPLTGCQMLALPTDTFLIDNAVPPFPIALCGVSVEGQHPRVSWPLISGEHAYTYTLLRGSGKSLSEPMVSVFETMEGSISAWTDTTADATTQSWCYALQITDPCGNTMRTETHCAVFLQGQAAGSIALNWSPYQLTAVGRSVQEYGLDLIPETDIPARIAWLDPTDFHYEGERSFTQLPSQCYRIATSTEGISGCPIQEYYSNKACFVFPPFVVLPNAFTPNNDDDHANDSLKFAAFFYREIQVQVFDRYGHEIWATATPNVFWDGKLGTALAPEGTYILRVAATSYTGEVKTWQTAAILIR